MIWLNNPVPVLVTDVRPHEVMEPGSIPVTLYADNLGEQGPQGIQGAPGPPNVLTIGTVTEGPADATITGTSPAQVLNLTLPAGGGGGGLNRLTAGDTTDFEFIDLVFTDGTQPWISGTIGGYVTLDIGAPAVIHQITPGTFPRGVTTKTCIVRRLAPGVGFVYEVSQSTLMCVDGAEAGKPGTELLICFGMPAQAGDSIRIAFIG